MKKSDVHDIMDMIIEVMALRSEAGALLAYGDVDSYEQKYSDSKDILASIRQTLYRFCEDR